MICLFSLDYIPQSQLVYPFFIKTYLTQRIQPLRNALFIFPINRLNLNYRNIQSWIVIE
jgi:hypothetical protein